MNRTLYTAIGLTIGLLSFMLAVAAGRAFVLARPLIVVLWIIIAVSAFLISRRLTPVLRSLSQLKAIISLPIIGCLSKFRSGGNSDEILPGLQQLLENLRGWLTFTGREIVITSADEGDGKSALASGLAVKLAQSGFRVTLVDINFRNPSAHRVFLVKSSPGLSEHLLCPDAVDSRSILRKTVQNLRVVPLGQADTNSAILTEQAFKNLVLELRADSDVIIYDCDTAAQMQDLLKLLDGNAYLLIVARLRHSYLKSLRALAAQLSQLTVKHAGLVLFGTESPEATPAIPAEVVCKQPA